MASVMLKTQTAQLDRTVENKVRGWIPVEGYEELFVHFTLIIPERSNRSAYLRSKVWIDRVVDGVLRLAEEKAQPVRPGIAWVH